MENMMRNFSLSLTGVLTTMKITFIYHSGFAVETGSCVLIFDFWKDPAGVVPALLACRKPVYVFSSHFHEDHFNREIFSWRNAVEETRGADIRYILSKDILRHRRARREEADVWLAKGGHWEDANVRVAAAGSNDSGVSWIVETDGRRLFHAGDLNNWYSRFLTDDFKGGLVRSTETGDMVDPLREEKLYLGELKDILKITDSFDVVMFPVDSRTGNGYTKGARQFISRFRTGLFIPMHFSSGGFASAWRMKEFTDVLSIPFWSISREGDAITL